MDTCELLELPNLIPRLYKASRMFRFATFHPELAKHVRRLQLRVPGVTSPVQYTRDSFGGNVPMPRPDWSKEENEIAMIEDAPDESPQQRRADLISTTNLGKTFWNSTWTIEETLALLPNLFHAENAVSILYRNALESDHVDLQQICEWTEYKEIQALESGFCVITAYMGGGITSLKLREVVTQFDKWNFSVIPLNLQHLDLDYRGSYMFSEAPYSEGDRRAIGTIRSTLKRLTQLRSLQLAFASGGDRTEEYAEEHSTTSPDPLYINDFLIDPQNDADQSFFPHLRSLRLVNCSLRVRRLQTIAIRHSATLRELELRKLTFDPGYSVNSWSEIGAMCHEALPNLSYLRLAKLITHVIIPGVEEDSENLPVPVRWNLGLEGATSYEWIKNGRGSGADLEMIGSKCPWTFEG